MRRFILYPGLLILFTFLCASCSRSKIRMHKEWGAFFKEAGVDGCLMLHNYYDGSFDVYKLENVQKRTLPAETFNIVIALAGLETGVIADTNSIFSSDSLSRDSTFNMTLATAFRTSYTPYFQQIVKEIGKKRMNYWIDSTYYGNKEMGNDLKTFWLDNTLQISPDEQMGLMERLYSGKLAFQSRSQRLVRGLLIKKETHTDTLCYQTGVGKTGDQKTGWLIGWLRKKDHPYFFVLKTIAADSTSDLNAKNLNILYKVLNDRELTNEAGRLN